MTKGVGIFTSMEARTKAQKGGMPRGTEEIVKGLDGNDSKSRVLPDPWGVKKGSRAQGQRVLGMLRFQGHNVVKLDYQLKSVGPLSITLFRYVF